MLTLAKSDQDDYRFTCATCPYEYAMQGKQVSTESNLSRGRKRSKLFEIILTP